VDINGRFLYGAPAANLKAEAELILREDPNPYPAYPGYRFGLAQDSWTAQRFPVALAGTDAQGKAQAQVTLSETPDTSRPLQARVRVSLFEPGGRPVTRSLNLPYRPQPFAIGIKPRFSDDGVALPVRKPDLRSSRWIRWVSRRPKPDCAPNWCARTISITGITAITAGTTSW
jgi:uncharacterized protein YfaS (alpha-2-macroglobulin family)